MDVMDQSGEEEATIRKGAWSLEEDCILINYIAIHGDARWNHLARNSGLRRTGKSCRLRWKNYLHPNVRRGDFTLEEQLRVIELHFCYGNRWSKIAECLPGRTDNDIKNYWRTQVGKQAKLLRYDVKSMEFRDFLRNVWLPTLSHQIQIQASKSHADDTTVNSVGPCPCPGETYGPVDPLQFMDYSSSEAHPAPEWGQDLSFSYGCTFQEIDDLTSCSNSDELSVMLLKQDIAYFGLYP